MIYPVYFGTYSKNLYRGEFDATTGIVRLNSSLEIESPSYIRIYGDALYGVSETDTYPNSSGALFSASIRENDEMKLISLEATNGRHPCHLCVYGENIFVANYSEGTLSVFKRSPDGKIKPSHSSIAHYGKGINPGRQKQAHIHFAEMSRDFAYLAVCDLGMDKVFLYPFKEGFGLSTSAKTINCPPGSGPRHLVFSRDGATMYVLAELSSKILVFKQKSDGEIQPVQEVSTLPDGFSEASTAAAIQISADGSYIAASNRGHDSIALFRLNDDVPLGKPEFIKTGAVPRDFRFSPDGRWILSANQGDGTVTVYDKEKAGTSVRSIDIPSPTCIAF
jgi:6-phosphogluconolactonase